MPPDGAAVENLRRHLAGTEQYARRLDRVAVSLNLTRQRGHEGARIAALALEERREDKCGNTHLVTDLPGVDARVGKRVQQKIGVVRESLGRFRFRTGILKILDHTAWQLVRDVSIDDRRARVIERRRIRPDRRAFVSGIGYRYITGCGRANGVANPESTSCRYAGPRY